MLRDTKHEKLLSVYRALNSSKSGFMVSGGTGVEQGRDLTVPASRE